MLVHRLARRLPSNHEAWDTCWKSPHLGDSSSTWCLCFVQSGCLIKQPNTRMP